MLPPVLAMRPLFVEKLWGGTRLESLPAKGRPGHGPPPGGRIGESWEVADLPEGATVVDGGPRHGTSLRTLVEEHGRDVVGERATPGPDGVLRFPLLVKLIDAADDLSVQVHPDEAYARGHPGTFAKDEAWLVVAVEPGARVLHGVRDGVDREAFRRGIEERRAHELLREVRVSVGDVLRIAPGTLHAVGRGCLLLEVQEPSDTTFRVWDYDRRDARGALRPLHVDQALAVARFGRQDPPLVGDAVPGRPAIATRLYSMALREVDAGQPALLARPAGEPAVVFVLQGEVTLRPEPAPSVSSSPDLVWDHDVKLPAGGSAVLVASGPTVRAEATAPATVVVMTTGV